jgi:hypothetical protein
MRKEGWFVLSVILAPGIALATAASGVVSNVILAQGTAAALDERISVSNTDPALPGDDHSNGWVVGNKQKEEEEWEVTFENRWRL